MPQSRLFFVTPVVGFEQDEETIRDCQLVTTLLQRRLEESSDRPPLEVFQDVKAAIEGVVTVNWSHLQLSMKLTSPGAAEDSRSAAS